MRYAAGVATSRAIVDRLTDDDYFATPGGVAHTPPTFLGNHDVGRAALNIIATGASRARLLDRVLLGYSLLYLLRGAPVIYYGDEVGMIGGGGDKEARGDLFATQVAAWRTEARVGGHRSGWGRRSTSTRPWRRDFACSTSYAPATALSRRGRRSSGARAARCWRSAGSTARPRASTWRCSTPDEGLRVTFATSTPLSGWKRLLGRPSAASSTRTGALTLRLPAVSASLLRATRRIPAARPSKPIVTGARDGLSGLWRVSARLRGDARQRRVRGQARRRALAAGRDRRLAAVPGAFSRRRSSAPASA